MLPLVALLYHVSGSWGAVVVYITQSHLVPCPTVRQYADICLFSTAQYKCPVAQLEQE